MGCPCYVKGCLRTCQYGVYFYECPYWQEWAAERNRLSEEEYEEEDESDDDW